MRFFSDNAAAACPQVLEALADANRLDTAYDGDAWSARMDGAFSDLFGKPVRALWVTTGTAANCLGLAALCPPYGSILCHEFAHIVQDEAGAPVRPDVHQVQPAALSITNATEYGLTYRPDEVAALGEVAKRRKLGFHMDGARFANAIAFANVDPADVTWRAGVDVLSFGFVKNGGMSAEALIFFDPDKAEVVPRLRKRAGHLLSKGRYSAAQILAMLKDGLWLANARAANEAATTLAKAAGDRLVYPVEANELFVRMTPEEASAIRAQGFDFYDWAPGEVRLVTSWDQDMDAVARLAASIEAL